MGRDTFLYSNTFHEKFVKVDPNLTAEDLFTPPNNYNPITL
jgi:hypothetical protein